MPQGIARTRYKINDNHMLRDNKGKHELLKDSREIRIHSEKVKNGMLQGIARDTTIQRRVDKDDIKDNKC